MKELSQNNVNGVCVGATGPEGNTGSTGLTGATGATGKEGPSCESSSSSSSSLLSSDPTSVWGGCIRLVASLRLGIVSLVPQGVPPAVHPHVLHSSLSSLPWNTHHHELFTQIAFFSSHDMSV